MASRCVKYVIMAGWRQSKDTGKDADKDKDKDKDQAPDEDTDKDKDSDKDLWLQSKRIHRY